MENIKITYIGDLRTKAVHLRSGIELITDAPLDNQGKGEFFSPTDLVATALGSCILTIMGSSAKNYNFSIDGTTLKITKIMTSKPRRIGEIILEFNFPQNNWTEKEKKILEYCTKNCPVGRSLHPDLKQTIILNF